MKIFSILTLLIIITACNEPIAEGPQQDYFFPLQEFINAQIEKLDKQQAGVEKQVIIGDKSETKKIAFVNWERELQPFLTADINKATYVDQYTITYDTLNNGNVWHIYQTENEDLNTRELKILKSGESIKVIEAITHTNNPIYSSNQKLTYYPDSAYSIEAMQDVRLTEEKRFKVEARILN